jgi:chromosomal replication initiator protein
MPKKRNLRISPYAFPGINQKCLPKYLKGSMGMTKMDILQVVANETFVSVDMVTSKCRDKELVDARNIYSKIMKDKFDFPLKEIGNILGGRDHTTIINNIRNFNNLYQYNDAFKAKVVRVFSKLDISF